MLNIDKDEKVIARELIEVFSKNKSVKKYFQSDIKWLKDRLSIWDKNYIRVGLVGVTSSGKSTLLNAILGDDILPTAVRPSSGTLITCSKGKKVEARVYFENGDYIEIPKEDLKKQLQKYGDENINQQNKYKVKIIDVKSPHYLFPESIQIIDSPGLGAHGLERHEQITMELLLPTVDLCMYVVTLKANSDSVTHKILHTIYDHQKPLIIVQNMLDSVEAKEGKNGVVLKTKTEVAADHRIRVERILNQVHHKLAKIVEIVQLSAMKAVVGRREKNEQKLNESQFLELINSIDNHVHLLRPKLYVERTTQIYRHLKSIQEKEEKFLSDMDALEEVTLEQQKELDRFKNKEIVTNERVLKNRQLLEKKVVNLENVTKEATQKIKSLSSRDLTSCNNILSKVEEQTKEIEKEFISSIRTLNHEVMLLLQSLNLHIKDYENDLTPSTLSTGQHFSVKKKIKKESYQRKKSGVGGGIARFFGKIVKKDWGYETEYDEYEVIDVEAISQNLKSYQAKFTQHVKAYIKQWEGRAESFLYHAREEINRRMNSFDEKANNLLEKQEIVEILFLVKNFITRIESDRKQQPNKVESKKQFDQTAKPEHLEKIPISEEVFRIYQLGHYLLSVPFKKCWETVQSRNEQKCGSIERSIIWGWDNSSLIQFTQRHLGIQFQENEERQLEKNGVIMSRRDNEIIVVNESNLHLDFIKQLAGLLQSGRYNMFVLVNLIQIGSTEKTLKNSALLKIPNIHNKPVNCVVQSFEEIKNADSIREGIHALFDKMNDWNLFDNGEILINDKNPLFSMISLELSEHTTILADAQEVLGKVKQNYQHLLATPYEEEYIRDFIKALIDVKRGVLN